MGDFSARNPFETSPNRMKSIFTFSDADQHVFSEAQFEDFGRESLGLLNQSHLDLGRESLGFIYSPRFEDAPRESLNNSLLNNAFLVSKNASSIAGSVASLTPSFSSTYLNGTGFSRISSVSSDINDFFDRAFIGSAGYLKEMDLLIHSMKTEGVGHPHLRTFSLPVKLEEEEDVNWEKDKEKNCSSVGNCSLLDSNNDTNDLVFIEANHLAFRLGNESALTIEECEGDLLDSIQEPEGFADVSDEVKPSKETVFKTIDKMFPKPKDQAKEMLSTLSEILNNSNPTEQQKSNGQNLLSSLSRILSSGSVKSGDLDDSGHSSVENGPIVSPECYEVLDLSKKSHPKASPEQVDSYENCAPLDLSTKSKVFASPKILPAKRSLIKNKSVGSNCSGSSNERSFDLKSKFRPKASKGPLKAVIPVDNMARKKSVVTPPQLSKLKKTSTPIHELNIKPMAQSTPDETPSGRSNASKMIKQKLSYSGDASRSKFSFTRRRSEENLNKAEPTAKKSIVRSYSMGESALKSTLNKGQLAKNSVLKENNVSRSGSKLGVYRKSGKENVRERRF